MKLVIQRVNHASVQVDGQTIGAIQRGLLLLVGITHDDTPHQARWLAGKCARLRLFEDESGKMNQSTRDIDAAVLSISQFTLYADCNKGNRPGFTAAAEPTAAEILYNTFNQALRDEGLRVATGQFGADMKVHLENDGPVTLIVERNEP